MLIESVRGTTQSVSLRLGLTKMSGFEWRQEFNFAWPLLALVKGFDNKHHRRLSGDHLTHPCESALSSLYLFNAQPLSTVSYYIHFVLENVTITFLIKKGSKSLPEDIHPLSNDRETFFFGGIVNRSGDFLFKLF